MREGLVADQFEDVVKGPPEREWQPKTYRFLGTWQFRPFSMCPEESDIEKVDWGTEEEDVNVTE